MSEERDATTIDVRETLERDELEALQLERLRHTVGRVLARQRPIADRLADAGVTSPDEIGSLAALANIPFTRKADLRANYPFGLLAVPREDLVRIHASSGTHGKPTVVGYTDRDLDNWTELMARCMAMAGVKKGMLLHNANTYGLFTGGFGFQQGAERIGATVVPSSGGFTSRQIMLMRDLGAQVLVATPSYALAIGQAVAEAGVDPAELRLELGLFGGEPWSERMRAEIEAALRLQAVNFYGLSEMCGPGVAAECLAVRSGLHVHEDHFIVEVIDPDTERQLAAGNEGELVFTSLTKEAMPMLRYRTGDIGTIVAEPCACGRTTARLQGLRGRHDDVVIVRGVNVHPSEVEHVLAGIDGLSPHYRLLVERPGAMDELTVECEQSVAGTSAQAEALRARLTEGIQQQIGLRVSVVVGEPGSLPQSEGKAVRVVDRRSVAR